MRNSELCARFASDPFTAAKGSNMEIYNGCIYSYSTVIGYFDPAGKCFYINTRKYSRTTSKHQSYLRGALSGLDVKEYTGKPAYFSIW